MSEIQTSLIFPTAIQIGNEKIQVDTEVSKSGYLPPQATYLQAVLEEMLQSPSIHPQRISYDLGILPTGTNIQIKKLSICPQAWPTSR